MNNKPQHIKVIYIYAQWWWNAEVSDQIILVWSENDILIFYILRLHFVYSCKKRAATITSFAFCLRPAFSRLFPGATKKWPCRQRANYLLPTVPSVRQAPQNGNGHCLRMAGMVPMMVVCSQGHWRRMGNLFIFLIFCPNILKSLFLNNFAI